VAAFAITVTRLAGLQSVCSRSAFVRRSVKVYAAFAILTRNRSREVIVPRTCIVLIDVLILSGTIAAQQTPTLTSGEKSGRSIFQTRCAMCHVGQEPATEMATDGAARKQSTFGPLLSKAQASNETALRQKIKDGGPRMPGYRAALTDEQIDQVIAFMKTIERPLGRLAVARPGE
jgi:mono/diheme cytochrome c family protein